MIEKFRKLSLENQLFISFLSISVCMLLLSLSITLTFNLTRQKKEIDKNLMGISSYIASMDHVVDMLTIGYPTEEARLELDSVHEHFSDLNLIVIYDTHGLRFYHTNRQETGETLVGGEETAILSGSRPYITTGFGTHGPQRRAFHAITAEDGTIIGFVMASVFTTYISEQAKALLPTYLVVAFITFLASILLSHGIVRILCSSLMGHHPQELLELYLRQDTVLNAMTEGIIASDRNGTVIFANQTVRSFLESGTPAVGSSIKKLFPDTAFESILAAGTPVPARNVQLMNHSLICSELPIGTSPDIQGVLTLFNDRSEVEALSDELSGARSMLDTLRAFNHEFLNKLHVILGYLQTGHTEQAIAFITNSSLVSSQAIRQTADCLRVSRICALVIGKMMHAAELGIRLFVTPDSRCTNKDLLLPMEPYITIVGNLLENAIEELAACSKDIKEITLGIYMNDACTIITCEDTGRGIRPDLLPHIFDLGISSKGENRGTGLYLIHQITALQGGEITIDTEEGEGTCITFTYMRKEPG